MSYGLSALFFLIACIEMIARYFILVTLICLPFLARGADGSESSFYKIFSAAKSDQFRSNPGSGLFPKCLNALERLRFEKKIVWLQAENSLPFQAVQKVSGYDYLARALIEFSRPVRSKIEFLRYFVLIGMINKHHTKPYYFIPDTFSQRHFGLINTATFEAVSGKIIGKSYVGSLRSNLGVPISRLHGNIFQPDKKLIETLAAYPSAFWRDLAVVPFRDGELEPERQIKLVYNSKVNGVRDSLLVLGSDFLGEFIQAEPAK
ncbi:MAG: hypothetical protein JWQ35_359 [Bacteriovoracaceae bacterium]|nr:hypothetical protein [Bacteriovoracaceae bacterium]